MLVADYIVGVADSSRAAVPNPVVAVADSWDFDTHTVGEAAVVPVESAS